MNQDDEEILVPIPGQAGFRIRELVLDLNGTLARDGEILPGVTERLADLASRIRVTVLTADTFGSAERIFRDLPVSLTRVTSGKEKEKYVMDVGSNGIAAMGNGRNDCAMLERAAIGIAVIGPEGAFPEALRVASVVVSDIRDGLDLLLSPVRLAATLRS